MRRLIPSAHSARHVAAAEAIDLDGDDISDAARAIYDGRDAPVARYARPARTTVARVLATCARGGVL